MSDTTLAQYVRASTADAVFVAECEATATQLVADLLGGTVVPDIARHAAILEVGANLYQKRAIQDAPASFGDGEIVTPWRPPLDPLTTARAILRPYLGPAIA